MNSKIFYDLDTIETKQQTMQDLITEMNGYYDVIRKLKFGPENEGSSTGPCAEQMRQVNIKMYFATGEMGRLMGLVQQCIKDQANDMQAIDEYLAQQQK